MMDVLGLGFSEAKTKPYLKMASQRISIANNRKTNLIKQHKREIAKLLQEGKEEKARIRVEHVIREDFTIEAYEILSLLCDLLSERIRYIASEQQCPPDLYEAVCTLIWSANRTDIPELLDVKKQLAKKYGKEFVEEAMANKGGCVNERVVHKLSVQPPSAYLVISYLQEIAKAANVAWEPTALPLSEDEMEARAAPVPSGFSIPMAPGSQLGSVYQRAGGAASEAAVTSPHSAQSSGAGYVINQEGLLELTRDPALSPSTLPQAPSTTPTVRAVPSVFDIPAAPGYEDLSPPPAAAVAPPQNPTPNPNPSSNPSPAPAPQQPAADATRQGGADDGPSFDDLSARFAALRK